MLLFDKLLSFPVDIFTFHQANYHSLFWRLLYVLELKNCFNSLNASSWILWIRFSSALIKKYCLSKRMQKLKKCQQLKTFSSNIGNLILIVSITLKIQHRLCNILLYFFKTDDWCGRQTWIHQQLDLLCLLCWLWRR